MSSAVTDHDPFFKKAEIIVDKAIKNKGEVASISTIYGNAQTFEDAISPVIYDGYLQTAIAEVDAGNWQTAYETARNTAIGNTMMTLTNQQ